MTPPYPFQALELDEQTTFKSTWQTMQDYDVVQRKNSFEAQRITGWLFELDISAK